MRLLHWNIEAGGYESYQSTESYPPKMGQIVELVKEIGADFVNLVDVYRWGETYSIDQLKIMFGYKHTYWTELDDPNLPHCQGKLGVMTMTNYKGAKFEKIRAYDRNFIKTKVKTNKFEVDIYTIHLNHLDEEKRGKETRALLKNVRNKPTIIAGDFNTIDTNDLEKTRIITDNPVIRLGAILKGSRKIIEGMYPATITKIYKQAGLVDWGANRGNTFPTYRAPLVLKGPAARLDYVFGSREIKLVDFKVLKDKRFDKISDHYPILVEVEM